MDFFLNPKIGKKLFFYQNYINQIKKFFPHTWRFQLKTLIKIILFFNYLTPYLLCLTINKIIIIIIINKIIIKKLKCTDLF